MRGLGQTALNTGEIASQCKKLMVAYNIGQRLFAKFVMNQVSTSSKTVPGFIVLPVARIAVRAAFEAAAMVQVDR